MKINDAYIVSVDYHDDGNDGQDAVVVWSNGLIEIATDPDHLTDIQEQIREQQQRIS